MDDKEYLQLSISAFITAIVIGLGWVITPNGFSEDWIPWINGVLLGISMATGLFFFYKYKINDSKTQGWEWVNNLVERLYQVFPQIALVPPLIVGVIIVTQNISHNKIKTSSDLSLITTKLSSNEQTINSIATEIHNISSCPSTELSTTKYPTTTPISCIPCCVTPTPSDTYTLTPTVSSTPSPTSTETSTQTPTINPTPQEIIGCVITHGLNVRFNPGVTETPSNHAKMWLTNGACMTILATEPSSPQWALIRIERWVRLNKGETEYVVTVTLTSTATPP